MLGDEDRNPKQVTQKAWWLGIFSFFSLYRNVTCCWRIQNGIPVRISIRMEVSPCPPLQGGTVLVFCKSCCTSPEKWEEKREIQIQLQSCAKWIYFCFYYGLFHSPVNILIKTLKFRLTTRLSMIKSSWAICWISGLAANAFLKAKIKRNALFGWKKKTGSLLFMVLHHLILILNTPVNDQDCFLLCTCHTKFGGLGSLKVKCQRHLVLEKLKCTLLVYIFPSQWLNRSWMHVSWLYSAVCGPALQSVGVICTISAVCIWGNKYRSFIRNGEARLPWQTSLCSQ